MATFLMISCDKEQDDLVTGDVVVGGLLETGTQSLNYVVGDTEKEHTFNIKVVQSSDAPTSNVTIYKSFFRNDGTGAWSNEVEVQSINVSNGATHVVGTNGYNYSALIEGLSIGGEALPAFDGNLNIGDYFKFRVESVTSNGTFSQNWNVKITVSTRLAGTYTVATGFYYHPSTAPDPTSSYAGALKRIIESVDGNTYKVTDIGPWENEVDNYFFFTVDEAWNITIPKDYLGDAQLIWGADPIAICQNNEVELATCDNIAEIMADGHDIVRFSYGYIRSSGTRMFDEVIIKD